MATLSWLAVSSIGRQLIVISNNYIKEEVEQRLLNLIVVLEKVIIRSYLISNINVFYIVIVKANKQQNL